ncbi:MAG: hypothetical protein DWQ10_17845 [Calditrichaeota bacterium]|nr:MAG: hypothetical protein DWQ10_17845 [Calditrichota bacterium]
MKTNKVHRWSIVTFSIVILSAFVFFACQENHLVDPLDETSDQTLRSSGADALAKSGNKVDLCHMTGDGSFVIISVSQNAVDAHLAHGDKYAVAGDCSDCPQQDCDDGIVDEYEEYGDEDDDGEDEGE